MTFMPRQTPPFQMMGINTELPYGSTLGMAYCQQRFPVDISCTLSDETRKAKKLLRLYDEHTEKTELYLFARVDDGTFDFKILNTK